MKYLQYTLSVILALFIFNLAAYTQDLKQIAITLDDLPIVLNGRTDKEMETKIFYDILNTLDKYQVKAAGFIVGKKITEQHHTNLLEEFVKRGHVLGNHTFNHPDLNKTPVEIYKQDIMKCDSILCPYISDKKYFRYPLLHRGDNKLKKEEIYQFLIKQDYTIASVSIDNDEYTFNIPARKAYKEGDTVELNKIGVQYIEHMKSKIDYFTNLSHEKLGREMKHILLLHMNFLNSIFLDDLLLMLKNNGWEFIQLSLALEDPAYSISDNYCGKMGLGWLERITNNDTIPNK